MSAELFSLKGKVALITGATNGIGQYMAVGLYEAGAEVIFTHRPTTDPNPTVELLRKANGAGAKISVVEADLVNVSVKEVKSKIFQPSLAQSSTGQIDILINNAGITSRNDFTEYSEKEYNDVMHVNLHLPTELSRVCISQMLEKEIKGNIVFTCSLMSFQGGVKCAPYAVSKGGIKLLVQALSNEFSSRGINVNGIAPGYIKTHMTQAISKGSERHDEITTRIPFGRWGTPEDFKGPVVFLCSKASEYVTGDILLVDGGWMSR